MTAERGEARERVVGFFCQVRVCFAFVYRIFGTTTKDFGCELHKRRKSGGWKKSALEHTKPAKNETNAKRQRFKNTHTHTYIYRIRKRKKTRTQSDLQREILLPVAVALHAGVDIERGDFVAQSLRPRDVGGLDGLDEFREF